LATAFLPAAVFGFLLAGSIEEHLFLPEVVAGSLFLGGIILVLIERKKHSICFETVSEMPFKGALFIGLFQCLAMVPGTSRSAATIIGALVLGASRKLAAEFSFYLAIPTILAASVYSLLKEGAHLSGNDLLVLSVGFFISFVVSLGVIRFLMDYIRKHSFIVFGYYRIVLAALVLLWLIWGKP
jgi:undecaprenyl-diphosphatase